MPRRNSRPERQYNRRDMATEVNLDAIIEAIEMANDSLSSYLDVETGEVRSITEEEFDLAEDPKFRRLQREQRSPSRTRLRLYRRSRRPLFLEDRLLRQED